MFRRVALFVLTNILVITTISIVFSILGVGHYISEGGINYSALAAFCLIWGMVGSFISLALSRVMAKWMMRVQVIDPNSTGQLKWLVQTTHQLARNAGLPKIPEVGIYDSPDINAFATGPTKSRSLVAVSTGLMHEMNQDEIEGVLAHEIAHIQNGDMVTMALVQGVINAFVMFFARVIAFAIAQNVRDALRPIVHIAAVIILQILFGLLGMIVVARFSRWREFRADAGSAQLAGKQKMVAALQALQNIQGRIQLPSDRHESMAAFQISDNRRQSTFARLLSTHPPLNERIATLQKVA